MVITLDDDARRYIALFESVTGATGIDCIIHSGDSSDERERIVIVVERGDMASAIGPDGSNVKRFEDRIGKSVRLIEAADDPADFVANALAPAAVYDVTIEDTNSQTAYVEVAEPDRGVAIGPNGQTIETARTLANRHFQIDDIQLA